MNAHLAATMAALVLALVATAHAGHMPTVCQTRLTRTPPQPVDMGHFTVVDSSGTIMASLIGYVHLFETSHTNNREWYLPLKVIQAERSLADDGNNTVALKDACVEMTVSYMHEEQTIKLTGAELAIKIGAAEPLKCDFSERVAFAFPDDRRVSCSQRRVHRCNVRSQPVADLVLDTFKLEIDGEKALIDLDEYSKRPLEDSCEYW